MPVNKKFLLDVEEKDEEGKKAEEENGAEWWRMVVRCNTLYLGLTIYAR